MRPAPKAREGHGEEIVHVRRKPRGARNRQVGGSNPPQGADRAEASGPIDTALELMFDHADAAVREVRRDLSAPPAGWRPAARSPRSQALSGLPASSGTPWPAQGGPTPCQAGHLRALREGFCREAGDRWKAPVALPSAVLPRVLAVRRAQHLKGSGSRSGRGNADAGEAPSPPRLVSPIAQQTPPPSEA